MGIMEGKVCVITGGAGSVGLESARFLLQEGAKVMLVDNGQEILAEAVRELGEPADTVATTVSRVPSRFSLVSRFFTFSNLYFLAKPIGDKAIAQGPLSISSFTKSNDSMGDSYGQTSVSVLSSVFIS